VLFRDVELQAGDNLAALRKLGLVVRPLRTASRTQRCAQPCPALGAGNRCGVYDQRPKRCHEFECGVLQEVINDHLTVDDALKVIRRALRHANRVKSLLRQLGDHDEHLPLARRFRRTRRAFEASPKDEEARELFGDLTLEVHYLNLLTSSRFYTHEK
jgi:Fe-S-cluster containining protein